MKTSDCKNSTRAQTRINPAWVTAEYDMRFCMYCVPGPFLRLSRKRLRHRVRQFCRLVRATVHPCYWPEIVLRRRYIRYKRYK